MLPTSLGYCGCETKVWEHIKRGHVYEEVPQECRNYNVNEERELPAIDAF